MKSLTLFLACLLTLGAGRVWAQTHSWTVFAGATTAGSTDGLGTAARFNQPNYLALDPGSNVFVTDTGNGTIRRISPAGIVTTYVGVPGANLYIDGVATLARFVAPTGIFAASNGTLLITEVNSHTLRFVTATREVATAGGSTGLSGSIDAFLESARFSQPTGIVVDSNQNTFIADTANHTIRKVTLASAVTTIAGTAGQVGTTDGVGNAARFNRPRGLAIDRNNNLYVTDSSNHTIRRISPDGIVTTVAGLGGFSGSNDGSGTGARFNTPWGVAVDGGGTLYVADTGNHTIRRITPSGVVTTIGGVAGSAGHAEGNTTQARFASPIGLAVDSAGTIYVAVRGNHLIARGALDNQPAIVTPPVAQTVPPNTRVEFSVSATGGGLLFQWRRNDVPIAGATGATYVIASANTAALGNYSVVVSNSAGSITSAPAALVISPALATGRITNLAIRSQAGTGDNTLIVGFAIGGGSPSGNKPVLIRGVGPTLSAFNVSGVLADPKLEIFSGQNRIQENDDWEGNLQISTVAGQVGAFAFSVPNSKDAATYNPNTSPGSYTVAITGNAGSTGVALAEIYDATASATFTVSTPRLTNVSARTRVGTGDDILIAGFSISGSTNRTVLIRAIGPTLATFKVPGALANPRLELYSGANRILENDDWGGTAVLTTAFSAVAAFALPADSRDAAILVTLAPGSYTAQVSGVGSTTGVALVEVYEVP
jgi:sugar lactone lactonase YvrE